MSNFNSHPPQTFIRIFRPWDCGTRVHPEKSQQETFVKKTLMKPEIFATDGNLPTAPTSSMVKTENDSFSGHESDRECASSSSSSSKSFSDEKSFDSGHQVENSCSISPPATQKTPYAMPQYYGSFGNQATYYATDFQHTPHAAYMTHLMPAMPPVATVTDYYYAAAAANSLPPVPTTNSEVIAANAFNSYALNLMEHEYVRVMAEDAHVKAVNARKQRPKKFKCLECGTAFSNNGQLTGHKRIHTGERPFVCDAENCKKSFTRNEELTRHKRIHTGLRPYPCTICGKKFGRRDHLKKHMRTHMPQERTAIFMPLYPFINQFQ